MITSFFGNGLGGQNRGYQLTNDLTGQQEALSGASRLRRAALMQLAAVGDPTSISSSLASIEGPRQNAKIQAQVGKRGQGQGLGGGGGLVGYGGISSPVSSTSTTRTPEALSGLGGLNTQRRIDSRTNSANKIAEVTNWLNVVKGLVSSVYGGAGGETVAGVPTGQFSGGSLGAGWGWGNNAPRSPTTSTGPLSQRYNKRA